MKKTKKSIHQEEKKRNESGTMTTQGKAKINSPPEDYKLRHSWIPYKFIIVENKEEESKYDNQPVKYALKSYYQATEDEITLHYELVNRLAKPQEYLDVVHKGKHHALFSSFLLQQVPDMLHLGSRAQLLYPKSNIQKIEFQASQLSLVYYFSEDKSTCTIYSFYLRERSNESMIAVNYSTMKQFLELFKNEKAKPHFVRDKANVVFFDWWKNTKPEESNILAHIQHVFPTFTNTNGKVQLGYNVANDQMYDTEKNFLIKTYEFFNAHERKRWQKALLRELQKIHTDENGQLKSRTQTIKDFFLKWTITQKQEDETKKKEEDQKQKLLESFEQSIQHYMVNGQWQYDFETTKNMTGATSLNKTYKTKNGISRVEIFTDNDDVLVRIYENGITNKPYASIYDFLYLLWSIQTPHDMKDLYEQVKKILGKKMEVKNPTYNWMHTYNDKNKVLISDFPFGRILRFPRPASSNSTFWSWYPSNDWLTFVSQFPQKQKDRNQHQVYDFIFVSLAVIKALHAIHSNDDLFVFIEKDNDGNTVVNEILTETSNPFSNPQGDAKVYSIQENTLWKTALYVANVSHKNQVRYDNNIMLGQQLENIRECYCYLKSVRDDDLTFDGMPPLESLSDLSKEELIELLQQQLQQLQYNTEEAEKLGIPTEHEWKIMKAEIVGLLTQSNVSSSSKSSSSSSSSLI
jgi:hypothetical protein